MNFSTPRPTLAATAIAVACALVTSCALPSDLFTDSARKHSEESRDAPAIIDAPPYRPARQLPSGARLEAAGVEKPEPVEVNNITGSLRPEPVRDDPRAEKRRVAKRVPEIVKRGRLIVGVDQSQNLLSFRDSVSGELRGFEVDLAHEIAHDIFGDRDKVDFRFIESADRTEALNSGRVDIIIRTMTITEDRQKDVAFSTPYFTANSRLLTLNNSHIANARDLTGRRVCVAEGSTAHQLARRHAPRANVLITRSWSDCLMALQLGQTQAVLSDDTILSGMAQQDPYAHIVGENLATESYGVGIAKPTRERNTRGTIRQVNATLERIRIDGTWNRLYSQWFGDYLPPTTMPTAHYRVEQEKS